MLFVNQYYHKIFLVIAISFQKENLQVNSFHFPSSHNTFLPHLQQQSYSKLFSVSTRSSITSSEVRIQPKYLNELLANDFVIIPDFIPPSLTEDLRNDIDSLRDAHKKFSIAKIGQDSTNELNTNIRVAETCFIGRTKLEDCASNPNRDMLYDILDTLCSDLSAESADVLDGNLSEFLYAFYPKGGFYRRHRDAIPNSASVLRQYSLLLYLNDDWKEEDCGQLRLHRDGGGDFLPEGQEPNYIDVEPKGGTLVLFKSDKIPHEVLDTNSKRYALVGWYNRGVTPSDVFSVVGSSEGNSMRVIMLGVSFALITVGLSSILS